MKPSKKVFASTFHLSFLISEPVNSRIKKVAAQVKEQFNTEFVFDGIEYFPHLTLYLFAAPNKNKRSMVNEVKEFANTINPTNLIVKEMMLSLEGWLMLEFGNVKRMNEYHRDVVNRLNSHRESFLRKKYRTGNTFSKLIKSERVALKKYGDRHSMELFHPHVSIAKFDDVKEGQKALNKYKKVFNGEKVKVSLLEFAQGIEGVEEESQKNILLYKHRYN